jgi:hypothetical protein
MTKPEALMLMPLLKGKWYFKTEGGTLTKCLRIVKCMQYYHPNL